MSLEMKVKSFVPVAACVQLAIAQGYLHHCVPTDDYIFCCCQQNYMKDERSYAIS